MKVEGVSAPPRSSLETLEPGSLPSYEGNAGQLSAHTQHTAFERDTINRLTRLVTSRKLSEPWRSGNPRKNEGMTRN